MNIKDGTQFSAHTLWQDSPVLVLVVRRPGCWICRNEALKLSSHRDLITDKLGIKMIAVIQENIEHEAEEFNNLFWKSEIYWDMEKMFYRALGDGEIRWSSNTNLLRPSVLRKFIKSRKFQVGGNFKGQGRILGGLYIISEGSKGIAFEHREKIFGDSPDLDQVLTLCKEISIKDLDVGMQDSVKRAIGAAKVCQLRSPNGSGNCGGLNGMCPDDDSDQESD
ncbi:hypothetical protein G9A89_014036 [Geosiphon pyriformis]|nr:hypothetical protein G9A89_014036 [Geosiphon pyriformis]